MAARKRKIDLVGIKEAAELIGWSRQKTSVYYRRGLLPLPVAQLACGPIWCRSDMVEFAHRERKETASSPPMTIRDEPADAHAVYRVPLCIEGFPQSLTLYWTEGGQYILYDEWRDVVSTHRLGYYQACLGRGIIPPSGRVVDVDARVRSLMKHHHEHSADLIRPEDVKHQEARLLMKEMGWFDGRKEA